MKHISQILKKNLQCLMTLSLLLILGCEKHLDMPNQVEEITININLSTPNLSLETKSSSVQNLQENKIQRVRIYAFDNAQSSSTKGDLIEMVFLDLAANPAHGTTKIPMTLTSLTAIKFYAVINEPEDPAIRTKLEDVAIAADLNPIKYKIAHYFGDNLGGAFVEGTTDLKFCLPMSGSLVVAQLLDQSTVDIPAIRCVSRVDVYLRKQGSPPERTLPDLPVKILPTTAFTIRNVGSTSFLFSGARQGEGSNNNKSCTAGPKAIELPQMTDNPDKSDYVRAFWLYTPQQKHAKNKMEYKIKGFQYGNTTLEILNSASVPLLENVKVISGNNIYKVYCTVGEKEISVDNTSIAADWVERGVDVNINKPNYPLIVDQYIAMDWWVNGKTFTKKVSYSANMDIEVYVGDITQDESLSVALPGVELNIGTGFPWLESVIWVKTEDKKGYISFTYKVDNSASKEDIIISIKYEEIVYRLNVSYDNGYVPPDKLPNLTERGTWAPNGLHFAKRGYATHADIPVPIAPSGDSDLFDWAGPINKNGVPAENLESSSVATFYGGGIKNVNAMVMVSYNSEHEAYNQAAHYCKRLGSKWYFPNTKEFEYILSDLKTSLGPSYIFSGINNDISQYWCSSRHGEENLQTVIDPNNGSIQGEDIGSTFYVRCIRDI